MSALKLINLEQHTAYNRCTYIYKHVNGLTEHSLDIVRRNEIRNYNTRKKVHIKATEG